MSTIIKVVISIVLVIIGLVLWLTNRSGALHSLAEPANTRALITILICVVSVTFGLTILLTALWGAANEDKELLENRFRRAREIFVSFVGILGTIVGFYFGSADKSPAKLNVNTHVEAGRVVASAQGGTAPYRFTIRVDGKTVVDSKLSEDGWFIDSVAAVGGDKVRVIADVVDAKDLRGSGDAHYVPAPSKPAPIAITPPVITPPPLK